MTPSIFRKETALVGASLLGLLFSCTKKGGDAPDQSALKAAGQVVDQASADVKILAVRVSELSLDGTPVDGKSVKVDIKTCPKVGNDFDCTETIEKAVAAVFPDEAGPVIENVLFDANNPPATLDCQFATVYTASRSAAVQGADGIGFHSSAPFEHRFIDKAKLVMDTRLSFPKNTKGEDVTVHRFLTLQPCRMGPPSSLELKPFMKFTDATATVFYNWDETGKNYEIFHVSKSYCPGVLQPQFCAPFAAKVALKDLGKVDPNPPAGDPKDAYKAKLPPPADNNLAMKTVYDAMIRLRENLHIEQAGRVNATSMTSSDGYGRIPRQTIESCLGNRPGHWSDIVLHYYCQIGNARSCYTNAITAGKSRVEAYDACKDETYFKWIVADQGDVFRYIMFSGVERFDPEQQQAVINAFYGQLKPAAWGDFDPADTNDCNAYRPRRSQDPWGENHCLATKSLSLMNIGR